MKRATVFVTGVAAGVAGTAYAGRKVKKTVKKTVQRTVHNTTEQLKPNNLVKSVGNTVKSSAGHIVDAVRDGRAAMHEREDELRARRDGTPSAVDDRLAPDETLYVDGRPVDTSRVVVMKAPDPSRRHRRHRGRRS